MIDMIDAKRDCRMTYFLAKTEPSTYSIDQLRQEEQTIWDGVKNPQAVKAISQMRPGDRVYIYHSGGQSAIF
jgi:predicted RNA-binding protein with PUA-like domain